MSRAVPSIIVYAAKSVSACFNVDLCAVKFSHRVRVIVLFSRRIKLCCCAKYWQSSPEELGEVLTLNTNRETFPLLAPQKQIYPLRSNEGKYSWTDGTDEEKRLAMGRAKLSAPFDTTGAPQWRSDYHRWMIICRKVGKGVTKYSLW